MSALRAFGFWVLASGLVLAILLVVGWCEWKVLHG